MTGTRRSFITTLVTGFTLAAGPLGGKPTELKPHSVLDVAADIRAPILGNYGGKDMGIPQTDVEAMRAKLKAAGNTRSHIDVYDDAGHGFFADYRDSYNEKDAKIAWGNAVKWFADNGVK